MSANFSRVHGAIDKLPFRLLSALGGRGFSVFLLWSWTLLYEGYSIHGFWSCSEIARTLKRLQVFGLTAFTLLLSKCAAPRDQIILCYSPPVQRKTRAELVHYQRWNVFVHVACICAIQKALSGVFSPNKLAGFECQLWFKSQVHEAKQPSTDHIAV